MGEMASLRAHSDIHSKDMDDQLGQKLLWTTLELEKLKSEVMEEMKTNQEYMKQLIHLLKQAIHERDVARSQLQEFLTKTTFDPANSNVTESNCSLSDTVAYSFPDQPLPVELKTDHASLIVETLANLRALPQKGRLLQAVLGAGPLLQTLLLAGPLPRWRIPPQVQPFRMPPPDNVLGLGSSLASRQGSLNFGNGPSRATCNAVMISSGMMSSINCDPLAKRPRLC